MTCVTMLVATVHVTAVLQFVNDLNSKYAPVLAASHDNATFEVGELVSKPAGSAVHMFDVKFDRKSSATGLGVRFVLSNTTAYCGPRSEAADQALDAALRNGPITHISSDQTLSNEPSVPDNGMSSKWFIGAIAAAGVLPVSYTHLTLPTKA